MKRKSARRKWPKCKQKLKQKSKENKFFKCNNLIKIKIVRNKKNVKSEKCASKNWQNNWKKNEFWKRKKRGK